MTLPDLRSLVVLTVTNPAQAARAVMALNLPAAALWQALVLMAVAQALIFGVSDMLNPDPTPIAEVFRPPLRFLAMLLFGLVSGVYALVWAGRWFGGTGGVQDVLAVMVWLQAMRTAVQAVALVLAMTLPVLAVVLLLVAVFMGIYILLHFVDQALALGSLIKAFGTLVSAMCLSLLLLIVFLSLTGVLTPGGTTHV